MPTYVSLNFSNPELKKIMPWTGTDKGPRAYSGTFLGVANYWKIEDFTVTDKFASGEDVAVFGKFTYRSVALGHVITSPFSIYAKVHDGKIVYFQFMEDTYATASSFRQTGSWVVKATVAPRRSRSALNELDGVEGTGKHNGEFCDDLVLR